MKTAVLEYIQENIEKTVKYSPEDKRSLIGLPYRYTTPCISDSFQELYYWDTYFTNVGLIKLGKVMLAKGNVDNMLFLVNKYGFMPNGNRTYYLDRSQPPFLSRMVRDVFEATKDAVWLASAFETLNKEYYYWQTKRIFVNGLNGYRNYDLDEKQIASCVKQCSERIASVAQIQLDEGARSRIAQSFMSFAESGWDCNSRFGLYADRYCSVDLNSLLYDFEKNMEYFNHVLGYSESGLWSKRAQERRIVMQILWDESIGAFTDYDPEAGVHSKYFSAASFYPLFCKAASDAQAKKTVENLAKLELEHGVSAGEKDPEFNCQWDYPAVWAPLQFVVYNALKNYGYDADAKRIASKYTRLVESVFEKTHSLWEKYNGNTGEVINSEYTAPPMMGWTAGVYVFFNKELEKTL